MTTEKFVNNTFTTLNGDVNSGDGSLIVVDGSHFPATPQFRVLIGTELILVTGVSGNTFTISRGQEGTTAAFHASGSLVTQVLTAGALDQFRTDILSAIPAGATGASGAAGATGSSGGPGATGTQLNLASLESPQSAMLFTSHISTLRGPSLPAGGTYTVLDMNGAGYLSKIFCTLAAYTGGAPSIKFQVYVDGEVTPSIDVFVEDMCCFRSGTCSSDRAGGGIGSNGLSFYFNFVAPFSSHIRVLFVDQINDGNDRLLGGYLEYKIGTGMNWGLYGKLWSSTMNYTVVPYATQNLLNITSATGGVFVGGYYDLTGEGDFHFLEGWFNAVIDGGAGSTNWVNGGGNFQVPTGNYMFDSNEDYGEDGFYFSATGGAHNQTRNLGLTFNPSSGHVAWYKWHYENPMVFSSTFTWDFVNGFNGTFPTISNTTVKGVLWYYTGAVGSVVAPTSIKGDQGVPGTPGAAGAPGTGSIQVVEPLAAARSPIILLTGNQTLGDSSGNALNITLANGVTRYSQLMPNSSLYGLICEGLSGPTGTYYQRNIRTPALDLVADMTVEFFLYVHAITSSGIWIISYGATGEDLTNNDLWGVNIVPLGGFAGMPFGFNLFWEHDAGVNVAVTGTRPCPVGQLVHFAFVRSGTNAKTYLDGVLLETFSALTLPNFSGPTQTLKIGAASSGSTVAGGAFTIGGIQVIGSALSDADILADAKAQMLWL